MVTPIRRRQHSRLAYWLWFLPLWLVFVPLIRFAEWRGKWPRQMMGKGMKKVFVWPSDVQPGASDIVISSYFKSGTNWMMQVATQIAWRGKAEFAHIHDLVPWPELPERMKTAVSYHDVDIAQCPTQLRVVKTHFAPGAGVPFNAEARYICVVRDPKAVFESSYPFVGSTMGPLMPKVANWLDMYLSPDALFGSWADFTATCWALRDQPNVLFITYEQMKRDLPATVTKVAAFMGVNLTEQEQRAVVEQSTFAAMKPITHKFDPVGMGPPWADTRGAMMRKGESKTGNELLPGSHARIDAWCLERLQQLHSDFPYAEQYGAQRSR
ncbi:MAG TPA: sulfotransferase domain-containing protein [Candidatus Acidoferrum sp.]|nr:sulfotransferase domain-containing protein [Candidatus Acidoferrum sp.]